MWEHPLDHFNMHFPTSVVLEMSSRRHPTHTFVREHSLSMIHKNAKQYIFTLHHSKNYFFTRSSNFFYRVSHPIQHICQQIYPLFELLENDTYSFPFTCTMKIIMIILYILYLYFFDSQQNTNLRRKPLKCMCVCVKEKN